MKIALFVFLKGIKEKEAQTRYRHCKAQCIIIILVKKKCIVIIVESMSHGVLQNDRKCMQFFFSLYAFFCLKDLKYSTILVYIILLENGVIQY